MNSSSNPSNFPLPSGFQFAAVTAGIKPSGKPDFALVVSDKPSAGAAMFTGNRVVAAPLIVGREHLQQSSGSVQAVLVNSGNANCATGQAGIDTCREVCTAAAAAFECDAAQVFPSSTGIIGVLLPGGKLIDALPAAKAALGRTSTHFDQFASAILTTDTRRKVSARQFVLDGKQVNLTATCKGAGMIYPQLQPHATMLAYIFTDAAMAPADLQTALEQAVNISFNRISIDGDTSTNDTVLLLASGASQVSISADNYQFQEALNAVCIDLARQIVTDGEGATHLIELQITGAATDADALLIAQTIAHSPLVKTAWAGNDPNWGRILAAVGRSGAALDPGKVSIHFGDLEICREGGLSPGFDEAAAHKYLSQPEFVVSIDLGLGVGVCRFWTCDFTQEYVSINADYST